MVRNYSDRDALNTYRCFINGEEGWHRNALTALDALKSIMDEFDQMPRMTLDHAKVENILDRNDDAFFDLTLGGIVEKPVIRPLRRFL